MSQTRLRPQSARRRERPDSEMQSDRDSAHRVFSAAALRSFRPPDRVFMFFERDHAWRQIWTDGRSHPKDLAPTWMGDSIGKWDGDTFVVDTVGLTEKSWLDFYGDPHSEDMHLIERYKRVDQQHYVIAAHRRRPQGLHEHLGGRYEKLTSCLRERKPIWRNSSAFRKKRMLSPIGSECPR